MILGKEAERLREEAGVAAAAAERMQGVLEAVTQAQSQPMRCARVWCVCVGGGGGGESRGWDFSGQLPMPCIAIAPPAPN